MEELLDVYQKQVRSVLEMAVPVWEPGLTKEESRQIERVQKTACFIIMGDDHTSYLDSLEVLGCQTLKERRGEICLKGPWQSSHPINGPGDEADFYH